MPHRHWEHGAYDGLEFYINSTVPGVSASYIRLFALTLLRSVSSCSFYDYSRKKLTYVDDQVGSSCKNRYKNM